MRADRLLQIMMKLESGGSATTRQLAEGLEVSERTIHRDMEALAMAGVPIYADRGARGGWRLTEGYRMDWAGLRKQELLSVLVSLPQRHLTDLGLGGAYESAVQKVQASLTPALRRDADYMRQRVYVDAEGWHPGKEELPCMPALQDAVWEGFKVRISYAAVGEKAAEERLVSPLGLVLKGSLWYLIAAKADGELRSYRVSRIRSAEQTNEPAVRPIDFDLAEYWHGSVDRFRRELPRYPVRAEVHSSVFKRLEQTRYVRVTTIQTGEAGLDWLIAELEFHTLESARDVLLGFGFNVCVLEPRELREALKKAAAHIAAMYQGRAPYSEAEAPPPSREYRM